MEKTKEWELEMLMEKLRAKTGQFKSFYESAKALRMALLEKRYPVDSVERAQLHKCLDTLQHNIKVTTVQAMVERLESVSRQLGLKFVAGHSGLDFFISSDMFYLELVLETSGGVRDVKVHHEGKVEQPQSCEELVACLSRRDFSDFTSQLEGLASIYQLNAEKKVKCKAYSALTSLETDLEALSSLHPYSKDPHSQVHKGPVGILHKRRGGHCMKLVYFVHPYDLLDPVNRVARPLDPATLTEGHSVAVCMEGSSAHKLQTTTLVSSGPRGAPVYSPMTSTNSASLPACFVLRLREPTPVCLTVARRITQVTDMECGDLSSPVPLLTLITQHISQGKLDTRGLLVNLPDQQHRYFMTDSPGLDAVLVRSVPFTLPQHVPAILNLLRQQALFNSVVATCIRPNSKLGEQEKTVMLEVSALSWQRLSVSLEHPLEESMATVEMDLSDISNPTCKIYTANGDTSSDYATKVFQRCLSIPVTMRALIKCWQRDGSVKEEQMLDADVEIAYSTYHPTDEIWVYNCLTEVWCRVLTSGDIPPKVSGCCALLHGDDLYTFGGYQHKSETGTTNHLYRLNLKSMVWQRLMPRGDWPVCCDKMAGWVYQDKLYFFGGFGPVARCRSEFQIVLEPTSELSPWPTGWNNQLAVYNIQTDSWEWPRCKGTIPAPRAAHAAAISKNKVYVFGGRLRLIRNNELHSLDLDTMTWSGNLTDASKSECGVPEGRTWHTLTFISKDRAVLYGGLSQYNAVLSDCWTLDACAATARWHKRNDCRPLLWHRSIYSHDTNELLIQGGLKRSIVATVTWRDHAYELLILPFAPKSLFRLSLDVVCKYPKFLKSEFPSLPIHLQSVITARLNNPS